MTRKSNNHDVHAINFSWLLRLRWGAIVGQTALILGTRFILGISIPLASLFTLVAIEFISNAALGLWLRRAPAIRAWMLGLVMGLDVALLTAMLYLTGGPSNPFTTLYLVNIALAAVVLPARWTWFLSTLSALGFGWLFFDTRLLDSDMAMHGGDHMQMHLEGMWVAFGAAAAFIVYFVQRVTRALAAREEELAAARALTARNEKLASLATLAAGAAHQLSTPLSVIAVAAKELERRLERREADDVADARLIREQVERCRDILLQLAADAGEGTGEAPRTTGIRELLHSASRGIVGGEQITVSLSPSAERELLFLPPRALAQALRAILKNACEASSARSPVQVQVERDTRQWIIDISDRGRGMSEEVLAHVGEPFFTTKGPESGMGLGVFLASTVVERLGGSLQLASTVGLGTQVRIQLPASEPRGGPVRAAA